MLDVKDFFGLLRDYDFGFFTGVPDSLLKDFCAYISDNIPKDRHILTVNEGNAIGVATGHHLATGKIPVVYMQNSGLGNTVNPLTSLTDPDVYSIPMLLVIGWRGEPGKKDEPQHIKMGRIQNDLLETLEVPYEILPTDIEAAREVIQKATHHMKSKSSPFALVVQKGTFEPYSLQKKEVIELELTRESAIESILPFWDDEDLVISTTGKASRELFELREMQGQGHAKDFLTVGSMGHSSSIALGAALAKPNKRVWCLDGDGALLMHMGSLAIAGQCQLSNFYHIVINNYAHDSVGGQPTASDNIHIPTIAKACGYKDALMASTTEELETIIPKMQSSEGPILLEIRCRKGARKDLGRPTTTPLQNKTMFMEDLKFPQTAYLGIGAVQQLEAILKKEQPQTAFLVTGKKSYENCGAKEKIESLLEQEGVRFVRFYEFEPNPSVQDVERGLHLFQESETDLVIAVGGGSAMDVAKGIAILDANPGDIESLVLKKRPIEHKGKPLVAIPTTAGTGSEATPFSVLYIEKTKYAINHPYAIPDYAIIDPQFTFNLPAAITAATGIDAFGQAIESYWSIHSTEISKQYARQAIRLILEHLPTAVNSPTEASRVGMSRAAYLAGKAIHITSTTACHSISYPITAHFHVPHGHAVGLTLGQMLLYNSQVEQNDVLDKRDSEYVKQSIHELMELLGADTIEEAAEVPIKLMQTVGLSPHLRDLGITTDDAIELVIKHGFNPERVKNNPRRLTEDSLRTILKAIQ